MIITGILMKLENNILELIKKHISFFEPFKCVYLFGSATNPDLVHNDIDLLVIYEKYSQEIENALKKISNELQKVTDLPIDLTVLSVEEEKDIAFLEKIAPNYLKIK